jgi:hypothetical protein
MAPDNTNELKRTVTRQSPVDAAPRKLSAGVLAKIRSELRRLADPGKPPHIQQFVSKMYEKHPELGSL